MLVAYFCNTLDQRWEKRAVKQAFSRLRDDQAYYACPLGEWRMPGSRQRRMTGAYDLPQEFTDLGPHIGITIEGSHKTRVVEDDARPESRS